MNRILKDAALIGGMALFPVVAQSVEIQEADPGLSARFAGRARVEEQFGSHSFTQPHYSNHLLGTVYYEKSREAVLVFGFRLTDSFYREWKEQGEARLVFSIIEFHEGDARKICPIHIERLGPANDTRSAVAQPSQERLGSILKDELETHRLYHFPLAFQPDLKQGDIVWIGLDGTNPLDAENHNLILAGDLSSYPGGTPPMLITGNSKATSETVYGMSLLQSLNRRFYAPETLEDVHDNTPYVPRWVNPFSTSHKTHTLEVFRSVLQNELVKLPENPMSVPDRFKGFHSSVKPESEGWELRFRVNRRLTSIALYPAVRWHDNRIEAYAFPRRFKITAIPRGDEEPVTVADWSQAVFPLNGSTPVIFPFEWKQYREVRIQINKGEPVPGGHIFALAEVSFSRRYDTSPIPMETAVGDSLEAPPYWSAVYATDGRTAFGLPRKTEGSPASSFKAFPQGTNAVQIILRRSTPITWSSFEFYPTQQPDGLFPEDFPQGIKLEFSMDDSFANVKYTTETKEPIKLADGEHPFFFPFQPVYANCVRITLKPADHHPSNAPLQLEEITYNGGIPLLLQGWYYGDNHITGPAGTEALYDRIINGNAWHTPVQRTVNLIRRDVLAKELRRTEETIQAIRNAHRHTLTTLKTGGIILAVTIAGLGFILQRRSARKAQLRIRHRIQQDLHDEIGSQLSAISVAINLNEKIPEQPPKARMYMATASQCAREAIASLREVIWLTDKEILTLDQCFDVMQNRARKMVHDIKLELSFPEKAPPLQLSYQTKRNLILLFTEALNNALKHSNADTIRVDSKLDDNRMIMLSVHDNGRGFALEDVESGIGLKSMKERAHKMNGKLEIESAPGKGTTIRFTGKL